MNMEVDVESQVEPNQTGHQVERGEMIDLNAIPNENMMIIPNPTNPQSNPSQGLYHMTYQPRCTQATNRNIYNIDITRTTIIHSYHHIQTHTPIQADPPIITHLPDTTETTPLSDHLALPTPYTVETPPPPDTPKKHQHMEHNPWSPALALS